MKKIFLKIMNILTRLHIIFILILSVLLVYSINYGFKVNERIVSVYLPTVDALMRMEIDAYSAHWWFEKSLAGDTTIEMSTVWSHLDNIETYGKKHLYGKASGLLQTYPFDASFKPDDILIIKQEYDILRKFFENRLNSQTDRIVGSVNDLRFHFIFNNFISQTDYVELNVNKILKSELNNIRKIRFYIMFLFIIVMILFILFYIRSNKMKKNDYNQLTQTKNRLSQKLKEMQRYLDIASVMIMVLDEQGKISIINKRGCDILEGNENEILGQNWFDQFIPTDNIKDVKTVYRQLMTGEIDLTNNYENPIITKKGNRRIVEWHNTFIRDDEGIITGVLSSGQDITEKKIAEQKIIENEIRFKTLFQKNIDAIFISEFGENPNNNFTEVNDAACNLLGYSREELLKLSPRDIGNPVDIFDNPLQQKKIALRIKEKGHAIFLSNQIAKNGDKIPVEINAHIVQFGNVPVFYAIARDIRERKKTEKIFRESETKFRTLADYTTDWEYWVQPDGTYNYVSPSCEIISGYTNKELTKNPNILIEIVQPEYKQMMKEHFNLEPGDEGPQSNMEYIITTKDNKLKWIEHSCVPIFNENGIFLGRRGTNRDITKRKEYDAELLKFNVLIDQSPFSVVMTDLNANIKYVNPFFESITGYHVKEAIGQNTNILKSGNTNPILFKDLWDTISNGKIWKGEFQNKKKNGNLFYESVTITPLKNHSGEISQYMAIKEDITEKKLIQDQLHQSQKMEAIGQFAGGIAHDFNNILTAILGFVEIGLMDNKDDMILSNIQTSSFRAANLVKKILGFSRKQVISPVILDVKILIDDLEKMLSRMIGEDIIIKITYKNNLPLLFADPGQIEQIIINLVVNARDAINSNDSSNRSRIISIYLDTVKIQTTKKENMCEIPKGSYIILSVSDTGTGMDNETKNKIFEPFFTTKEEGKGTGLGLSTIFGIIKQNKGYITVYSEIGTGTTFNIYWPVFNNINGAIAEKNESVKAIEGNETIVIVEDDEAIITMINNGLTQLGYKVIAYTDPILALEEIPKLAIPIDLVIADVIMPHMSGKEFTDKLLIILPELIILFASGYTDDHISNTGILKGDINFISKPYSLSELTHKIKGIIKKSDHATTLLTFTASDKSSPGKSKGNL